MIRLDYKYTTLNEYIAKERGNRYAAAKIKRDETYITTLMLKGVEPIKTPCGLRFYWHRKHKRHDLDNVSFGAKAILDSMVKVGILPNDNLTRITRIEHVAIFGDKEYVEIERID